MNGEQIKRAREARGWTQAELATAVGTSKRTVGNWERGTSVPKNRMGMLIEVLGDEITTDDPIRSASDVVLLSELLRRAAARTER